MNTNKIPYELWKGYKPKLNFLKMWVCLTKLMLPDSKKRKIGSKTSNCMFIGYVEQSSTYRFLVLKSDVLDHNFIIETKNVEFFELIFPLKLESIPNTPTQNIPDIPTENIPKVLTQNINDNTSEGLRRSKRQRKETSFGSDFYTYLARNDPITFSEAISSSDASFWKEDGKSEIESIKNYNTWILVIYLREQSL